MLVNANVENNFLEKKHQLSNHFNYFLCLNISELTIGILTSRGFPGGASAM